MDSLFGLEGMEERLMRFFWEKDLSEMKLKTLVACRVPKECAKISLESSYFTKKGKFGNLKYFKKLIS